MQILINNENFVILLHVIRLRVKFLLVRHLEPKQTNSKSLKVRFNEHSTNLKKLIEFQPHKLIETLTNQTDQIKQKRQRSAYLELAIADSRVQKLRERIGVGVFNTRRPSIVSLIAKEDMALVREDCVGKRARIHLRAIKAVLGSVIGGGVGSH